MGGPLDLIAKGIGSGIGLASEAIAHQKEKKRNAKEGRAVPPNSQAISSITDAPCPRPEKKTSNDHSSDSSEDEELDIDSAQWALDDAAAELEPPAYQEFLDEIPPVAVDDLVKSFHKRHDIGLSTQVKPIPMPVILPQRRPKDKSRGFIRAYAPILGECSNIDEKTFLDFLDDFYQSSKTSPIFDVINLGCFAAGLVPNSIAMGVTIAVQVANQTAKEVQGRYRTNNYLAQINETLFKPRGLFAMIMAFEPDSPYDPVVTYDANSTVLALRKSLSTSESELKQKLKKLRVSAGTAKGELSLPEAAPLIYPAIDAAALAALDGESKLPEKKQKALKSSGSFLASYLDRRAQAKYAGIHPDSKLANAAPPQQKFASRFSDPNHPANSGTVFGLLTGGKFDPTARKRVSEEQRRAQMDGRVLSQADINNAYMGRSLRKGKGKGPIGRLMKKHVLYLIITNLPSESELREINQEWEKIGRQQMA